MATTQGFLRGLFDRNPSDDMLDSIRRTIARLQAERRDFPTSLETTMRAISAELNFMQKASGSSLSEAMICTFSADVRGCGQQLLSANGLSTSDPLGRMVSDIFLLEQKPNYWNPVYGKPYFRITPGEVYRELKKFRRQDPMAVLATYAH